MFSKMMLGEGIPAVKLDYNLADVSTSTGNWISSIWLAAAFAISIPLAFLIIRYLKGIFVSN
ncbi:hypothetical protein ACQVQT_28540 [Bacillus paranthracis]|uniref:DUF2798 domain-containing protein n=2 Tax=Bacillus cereus group TaxID=86661 RepID=A0AAX3QLD2_9BACI|nr:MULTISPECIES: hypothetical protein [Bacillus cereus group]KLA03389.1 hypothetical protein B4153_5939 [Bacillus cereus]KXI93016.1 hypothetical protein ACS47_04255 [Bacillus cereus]MBR9742264.1 hypothetical protein [Bacillus paranthracis]MCU4739631.1 hypothetical protein [Bacillus paranthracis]MCU5288282.1 hypothetical protein [Bacillus paranthracis]